MHTDDRFRMDERFAESDEEIDVEPVKSLTEAEESSRPTVTSIDIEDEVKRSLDIMSRLFGDVSSIERHQMRLTKKELAAQTNMTDPTKMYALCCIVCSGLDSLTPLAHAISLWVCMYVCECLYFVFLRCVCAVSAGPQSSDTTRQHQMRKSSK